MIISLLYSTLTLITNNRYNNKKTLYLWCQEVGLRLRPTYKELVQNFSSTQEEKVRINIKRRARRFKEFKEQDFPTIDGRKKAHKSFALLSYQELVEYYKTIDNDIDRATVRRATKRAKKEFQREDFPVKALWNLSYKEYIDHFKIAPKQKQYILKYRAKKYLEFREEDFKI